MRTHRIKSGIVAQFGASSKLNGEWDFVSERRWPRQAFHRRSWCAAGRMLKKWASWSAIEPFGVGSSRERLSVEGSLPIRPIQ